MRREEPHRCIGQMRPANKIIVHVVIAILFDGRNLVTWVLGRTA